MKLNYNNEMKSLIRKGSLALAVVAVALTGCRKEFDNPPIDTIPDGNYLTIQQLRDSIDAYGTWSIKKDYNVLAVVSMDEGTGNIYKEVYIKDNTSAINVRLSTSGGLYVGDSIRINLNGAYLSKYNQMAQIDSVDVDEMVVKQATNVAVNPTTVTIDQIDPSMQAQLVRIENVEFVNDDLGTTYADAANQQSQNKTLTDCVNQILVRNSGYADFAGDPIPTGGGTFIGIVGQFNNDMQLLIRDPNELSLDGARCSGEPPILNKNFEDQSLTSGGWTSVIVTGSTNWVVNSQGTGQEGTYYGNISNYNGSNNTAAETWFISPQLDLSGLNAPTFSFTNAYNYNGAPLEVYISTNYTGGAPSGATWTQLNPTLSTGGFAWVNSGDMDLSSYIGQTVHVAFKYTGSNSDGSTWEIDAIQINDN